MSDHPKDRDNPAPYEVGYGKPPVSGRFVKGKSGNPRGRKKRVAPKPAVDEATRDQFLSEADRLFTARDGDTSEEIPAARGVMRAQIVAALKGSPVAQKHFLDRNERHRNELAAEIKADHEFWRNYVTFCENWEKQGRPLPENWYHPEDLIFEEGCHVKARGGDPVIALEERQFLCALRDACLLQAEMDRREFHSRMNTSEATPVFAFEVIALALNEHYLSKRFQLNEIELLLRTNKHRTTKKRDLEKQRRMAWSNVGIRRARTITPKVIHELLVKLGIDLDKLKSERERIRHKSI